jgi:hypothetical protein
MVRRLIGVAVLLATMALPAFAQVEEPQQKWAVRLGVLWPTASNVRSETDTFWAYIGLERNFPGTGIVSLDYTEGSGIRSQILPLRPVPQPAPELRTEVGFDCRHRHRLRED